MLSPEHQLPPVPVGESPIPISETPREVSGVAGSWLARLTRRGDGPPSFRPPKGKRPMTYPAWVKMWRMGLLPVAPPTPTPPSLKRPQPRGEQVRERAA